MSVLLINLKKINNNEDGFVFAIIFLLLLPTLIFLMVSSAEVTRTERATNATLQQALCNAVNDAAHMVDRESQAMGEPKIDYERAHDRFLESLNYNLILLNDTPSEASSIAGDITYWLLVYNGDDKYKGYKGGKVASYACFTNENGYSGEEINNDILGFPYKLDISENGFISGEQNISAILENPSVVAIITTNIHSVTGDGKGERVTRWALAKIVKKE